MKKHLQYKFLPHTLGLGLIASLALIGISFGITTPVHADATIVVNSTADDQANDGECTLREAIIAANTNTTSGAAAGECAAGDSGHDTINFNITEPADFTNNSENGYIIQPNSSLPSSTEQVTINGYSQPGAEANTAVAPNPFNGTLLIEINGENAGSNSNGFLFEGNDSLIKGLAVVGFDSNAISVGSDNLTIQGSYLGVDHSGMSANANGCGICQTADGSENAVIGGLNAEDRNIISGNTDTASSPNTASHHWIYQGNYIGVGADGLTAIPNASIGGSGNPSLDNSNDHVVGGPEPTAINVIGSSLGHGIAPHNSNNLLIENNFIGLGYDGVTMLGNLSNGHGSGIALSDSEQVNIKNNRIAGWKSGGISINPGNNNVIVEGNIAHSNSGNISVLGSSEVNIINNTVYNSTGFTNISVVGFSVAGILTDTISVQGNNVGYLASGDPAPDNDTMGITVMGDPTNILIGGVDEDDGNKITGQSGAGIVVMKFTVDTMSASLTPQKVSVLGNTVTKTNGPSSFLLNAPGLGIDLVEGIDTDSSPDGAPNTLIDQGVTANDTDDSDTGPNNFINFPVLNSVSQEGDQVKVNLDLDAADSPTGEYRVEFFANDQADSSGHGEGQTFLGFANMSNGNAQSISLTLPGSSSLAGKSISATTTAIDNTTDSGFGGTSEFSRSIIVNAEDGTDGLASTGQSSRSLIVIATITSMTAAIALAYYTKRQAVS